MTVTTNYLVTGNGITGSTANAVQALVSNAGNIPSRRLGNTLTKGFLGRFTTKVNGADHTTHVQTTLEGHYDAVRLIIPNSVTSSIAGVKAKCTSSGTAGTAGTTGSTAPSDGTWKTFLWSASSSVTLAAGTSADAPSWTVSDWLAVNSLPRADGGTLPLFTVRIYIPAAAANRPAYFYTGIQNWEDETLVAGRIFRPRTQAVNGVDTLGNLTAGGSVTEYDCVPFFIQYASRVTGMTVLVAGNSRFEKAGSTHRYGWQDMAQAAVSSVNAPVEFCTVAIGGSNSATTLTRLAATLPLFTPDYTIIAGCDTNDLNQPITAANINTTRTNIQQQINTIVQNNSVPIIATDAPASVGGTSGKTYGTSDSLRRDLNDAVRAVRNRKLLDFDRTTAGTTNAGQVEISTSYTTDNLHLNAAGHQAIATADVVPAVNDLLLVNGLTA